MAALAVASVVTVAAAVAVSSLNDLKIQLSFVGVFSVINADKLLKYVFCVTICESCPPPLFYYFTNKTKSLKLMDKYKFSYEICLKARESVTFILKNVWKYY